MFLGSDRRTVGFRDLGLSLRRNYPVRGLGWEAFPIPWLLNVTRWWLRMWWYCRDFDSMILCAFRPLCVCAWDRSGFWVFLGFLGCLLYSSGPFVFVSSFPRSMFPFVRVMSSDFGSDRFVSSFSRRYCSSWWDLCCVHYFRRCLSRPDVCCPLGIIRFLLEIDSWSWLMMWSVVVSVIFGLDRIGCLGWSLRSNFPVRGLGWEAFAIPWLLLASRWWSVAHLMTLPWSSRWAVLLLLCFDFMPFNFGTLLSAVDVSRFISLLRFPRCLCYLWGYFCSFMVA